MSKVHQSLAEKARLVTVSKSRGIRARRYTLGLLGAKLFALFVLLYCVRIYSYEYCGALGELELTSEKQMRQKAHIFVATDNSDLRPLIVVVNSTLNSPTNSKCIVIVVIVPRELASQVEHTFQRLFSGYRSWLIIDSTSFDSEKVARLPGVLATRKTKRKELGNPYNFAAFYIAAMPKYAHVTKAVYLDIDTVVQGDLHELLENCCDQNTPMAVVEDCSQRVRTYISTSVLAQVLLEETLPSTDDTARLSHAGEACVFNRGVLVLNLPIWREMNITKQIENWMEIHDTHERSSQHYTRGL